MPGGGGFKYLNLPIVRCLAFAFFTQSRMLSDVKHDTSASAEFSAVSLAFSSQIFFLFFSLSDGFPKNAVEAVPGRRVKLREPLILQKSGANLWPTLIVRGDFCVQRPVRRINSCRPWDHFASNVAILQLCNYSSQRKCLAWR